MKGVVHPSNCAKRSLPKRLWSVTSHSTLIQSKGAKWLALSKKPRFGLSRHLIFRAEDAFVYYHLAHGCCSHANGGFLFVKLGRLYSRVLRDGAFSNLIDVHLLQDV